MRSDALDTGDFSLTLGKPTKTESSNYTCSISDGREELRVTDIQLQVKDCLVEVKEGEESVQLPFKTTGNLPENATVEWEYCEPECRKVHVYENGSDQPDKQDEKYRGRTSMNEDLLKTGDLSLTLKVKDPTDGDSGRYRCEVKRGCKLLRRKMLFLKGTSGTEAAPLIRLL
ncbi:butyrophilin-like protein 10 [Oreochromis niloticus]|uniref:butyrophilin-like protein 10 n=1 Tax=Oreochromis niloticus TaxID=8128 RepID=UPI000DF464D0|nr:butyrophilin-like protein 10 [Oreochromis niloticus]